MYTFGDYHKILVFLLIQYKNEITSKLIISF